MPVHLLPDAVNSPLRAPAGSERERATGKIRRRDFLAGVLGAGLAGPSLLSAVANASDEPADAWIALLSDTHIAADTKAVNRGQTMADNLKKVVDELLAQPTKPRAAFIDGDLALQDGQSGDYATLVQLLAPLRSAGIPLHLGLGNHDDREHFRVALEQEAPGAPDVVDKQVSVVPLLGHRFVILDSLDRPNVTPGKLGDGQLAWLGRILDAEPQTPVVVLMHHNLAATSGALTDTPALLSTLVPRRQVKAVVYGHTHAWETKRGEGDLQLVNLPAIAYPFAQDQPLGWCRLNLDAEGAELQLHATGGDRSKDGQRVHLHWRSA